MMVSEPQPRSRRVLRRSVILAGALAAAYPVAVLVANPPMPRGIRIEPELVLVATLFHPPLGLLLAAALAPLGDLIVPLLGAQPARHAETVVLAFLAGWLASYAIRDDDRPTMPGTVAAAMWLFGSVLVASVATNALQLSRESPDQLRETWRVVRLAYLWTSDPIGVHAAAALIEGMLLVVAVAWIVRRYPAHRFVVPVTLVASGVVAAVSSALLARGIAPANILTRQLAFGLERYSAPIADVNAAASYYVLLAAVSIALAAAFRRTRVVWLLGAAAMFYGLWLTGSRAGFVAAAVGVAAATTMLWVRDSARSRARVVAIAAAVLVVGIVVASGIRSNASSLDMRAGFTRAALRVIAARPVFGIGAGRYYDVSELVLPPSLAWYYGRENAHDYFLQIAAELGLTGALVFAWMLLSIVIGSSDRSVMDRNRVTRVAMLSGVVAYLVTMLGGHPFLVPEASTPFWIVLGLLLVDGAAVRRRVWPRHSSAAIASLLLLTVPFRPGVPRFAMSEREDGFGASRTDEHHKPFRPLTDFASLVVGPTVTSVEIPMRIGNDTEGPIIVGISVPGSRSNQLAYVGRPWSSVLVALPKATPLMPRQRINFALQSVQLAPTSSTKGVYVGPVKILTAE